MATAANTRNLTMELVADGSIGYFTQSLAAAGNGYTLIIPATVQYLAVSVLASAGAKLQVSLDPIATIIANTETYIDWPHGSVTTEQDMSLNPAISALRLVQTQAGTSTIKVRAKS